PDVAYRLFGEPAEELGGVADLTGGLGHRLAVLADHQLGQFVAVTDHQLERFAQNLRSLARRLGRPRAERPGCRVDRGDAVMDGGACDAGDYVAGGGVGHVDSLLIGRRPPAAVDVQVGMPDGDQLTDRGHHIDFLTVWEVRGAEGVSVSVRRSSAGWGTGGDV